MLFSGHRSSLRSRAIHDRISQLSSSSPALRREVSPRETGGCRANVPGSGSVALRAISDRSLMYLARVARARNPRVRNRNCILVFEILSVGLEGKICHRCRFASSRVFRHGRFKIARAESRIGIYRPPPNKFIEVNETHTECVHPICQSK